MGIYMHLSIRIKHDTKMRQSPLPMWLYNLYQHEFNLIQCNLFLRNIISGDTLIYTNSVTVHRISRESKLKYSSCFEILLAIERTIQCLHQPDTRQIYFYKII
jgi:hypothetical protein